MRLVKGKRKKKKQNKWQGGGEEIYEEGENKRTPARRSQGEREGERERGWI